MKKKGYLIIAAIGVILAVAMLLSVGALIAARSEITALTEQVRMLEEENRALRLQVSYENALWVPIQTEPEAADEDAFYCTLVVDSWEIEDDVLTVHTFAQAALAEGTKFTTRIELWHGDAVVESRPVTLDIGEADGIFEADVSLSFPVPQIDANEELQLWLTVKPAGGTELFACGAGWYLENGQLLLITG